jgi:hypothetical protein
MLFIRKNQILTPPLGKRRKGIVSGISKGIKLILILKVGVFYGFSPRIAENYLR